MKIALGVFDGVHRGHQKVIETAHLVLAITPHPHPQVQLLTSPAEKRDLIGNLAEFRFSARRARLTPEKFLDWLVKKYSPEALIVGHDFHFGYQRQGNVTTLKQLSKKYNFHTIEIPEYRWRKELVRSSAIRQYLLAGQVRRANELLGREYQLNGKIIKGQRLGRRLGAPTINLKIDHPRKLIPLAGVYAAEAISAGKIYPAAVFIKAPVIEAHLLGFSGNLYGQKTTLLLQDYVRAPRQFASLDQLAGQIQKDIKQIADRFSAF